LKTFLLSLSLLILSSCSQPFVTHSSFSEIPIGANMMEVEAKIGKAYKVNEYHKGEDHLYIERISLSRDHQIQKHYTITYSNGVVTKKTAKEIEEPNIQANFY
jgi:hypothetical protein